MKKVNIVLFIFTTMMLFSQNRAKFFRDPNYKGPNISLPEGFYTASDLIIRGIGSNRISSIQVSPGYQVTIFDLDNFAIDFSNVDFAQSINGKNVKDLASLNMDDKTSSIIIRKIPTTKSAFYMDCSYKKGSFSLPEGFYGVNNLRLLGHSSFINQISSVKTNGLEVLMYDKSRYEGYSRYLPNDVACLKSISFDNMTESIIVLGSFFSGLGQNSSLKSKINTGTNEGVNADNDESALEIKSSTTTDLQLNVYPNPATDFVDIKHSGEIEKVELVNYSGKKENIKVTKSSNNTTRIDLSAVQGGAYLLVGTTKNGESISKRIIIQNKK
ncbi:T9SS type A sorting domain-containing protein [Chryseobacterium aquaeductus]|nr:T9SS type A sorting domain-containing protein [Chryseobacterium aquaeductus]